MTITDALHGLRGTPRILEIGDRTLFKREMPDVTTFYWTGQRLDTIPFRDYHLLDGRGVRTLNSALRRRDFDCVIWHPGEAAPWRETLKGRRDARHWWMYWLSRRLDLPDGVPLVVFDTLDRAEIPVHVLPALARAHIYFKRELPLDPERLMPARASSRQRRYILSRAARLKPASIGVGQYRLVEMPSGPVLKTVDVFFAGQVNTRQRRADLPNLRDLVHRGITLDIPAGRLSRAEFYRRCAAAWLVWSPEGSGWDCFRHYEAAACGSVPVMNVPSIRCHQPFQEGVNGLYYDSGLRPLDVVVLDALADKDRLRRMGEAARSYVLKYHTHAALCRMVLDALRDDASARPS